MTEISVHVMCMYSDGVGLMPVATLAGVIVTVALHTMQWHNLTQLHILPPHDTAIIIVRTARLPFSFC